MPIVSNIDTIEHPQVRSDRTYSMNNRHKRTLAGVLVEPTRGNIVWADIEALFRALDAEITEGRGSRVRVALNGVRATFHRPHPGKEAGKGTVESVRGFLDEAGVGP